MASVAIQEQHRKNGNCIIHLQCCLDADSKRYIQDSLQYVLLKYFDREYTKGLLYKHRCNLSSLLCCDIRQLLQLLGAHLAEISEQQDELEFDPTSLVSILSQVLEYLTYLSFVIMRNPCTSRPFKICGPIPLNSAHGPSCSMM